MSCFRSFPKPTSRPKRHKASHSPPWLLSHSSASPLLHLSLSLRNENRSTDELAASSSSSFVCSSTSLHRSRMPSPILASLLFSEHFLSSILREPDKILTLPPLVFTGVGSHRLHHDNLRFHLFYLSVSLDNFEQTLTFDFSIFQLIP